jgi:hypothetical protein
VVSTSPEPPDALAWGLCASCRHHRVIANDRGSRFVHCALATVDRRFPRYPRLPVRHCDGYDRAAADGGPVD